ncbi:MAG: HAMP domain-containing sensor histidine kinase [Proteobacteria bacterium]|nr:HAMP domain-containing sensor histidine kinase [Pseudomonadota bacterium]
MSQSSEAQPAYLSDLPGLALVVTVAAKITAIFGTDSKRLGLDIASMIGLDLQKATNLPFKRRHIDQCLHSNTPFSAASHVGGVQYECQYNPHMNAAGKVEFLVCYARDVTRESKLHEELDHHRFEITALNRIRSLEGLSSGIAHEINNPLTIMMGSSDAIKRILESQNLTSLKLDQFFTSIAKNGQRIKKIVEVLRDLARDDLRDPAQEINMDTIISGAIDFARKQFDTSKIKIKVTLRDPQDTVKASGSQLMHAIEQVLLNAFEAASYVSPSWVHIAVNKFDSYFEISITDSGAGIAPDLHHKIMQPFFTTREVGKGIGIGLNVAKRVLESHGGSIALDVTAANTRFVLKLPATENAA